MNQYTDTSRPVDATTAHTRLSHIAYGVCSALMPYVLATLLLIAFG